MAPVSEPRIGWEPAPEQGWVAPHLAAEFPGLGHRLGRGRRPPGRSPEPVRRRLRDLSDRFYGAQAIHMRERPIPWAYRVFFRQIGLDPDRTRTPVEQLAFERIRDGGFKSDGLPADALTIATVETGVALRAFDADRLERRPLHPRLGPGRGAAGPARRAGAGDAGDRRREAARSALLFGSTGEGYGVEPESRRLAIVAVQVNGVPQIAVDEALWMAAATVDAAAPERGLTAFRLCHSLAVIYTRSQADAGSARKRQPEWAPRRGRRAPRPGRAAAPGRPARARARRALRRGLRPGRDRPPRRRGRRASRGSSTSASSSGCATSSPSGSPRRGRRLRERARVETAQPRAAAPDAGRAGGLQVGAGQPRRPRPARLRPLALAPAPRPDRDADGLVAGQGLLGMSVSRAACGR